MINTRYYHYYGAVYLSKLRDEIGLGELDPSLHDYEIEHAVSLTDRSDKTISYYMGKKYNDALNSASGGVVLCKPDHAQIVSDAGSIALITSYPRAAFAKTIRKLYARKDVSSGDPFINPSANIHEDAHILPGAVIGAQAVISAGASIGPNAVIGPGVLIGAHTHIDALAVVTCADIGAYCRIGAGAIIGGEGFGVTKDKIGNIDLDHIGTVILADHVSIGSNTTIDRGMLNVTQIGVRTKIDNLCQIGHNTVIGDDCLIAAHVGISGSCTIGHRVMMGGNVGIADHIRVGDDVVLAGASGVMKNVPNGEVWSGFPAKPTRTHMREVATLSKLARRKK